MIDTLLLTQDFPPEVGGTQTYAHEVAVRLASRGRIRVIAPSRSGSVSVDATFPFEVERVAASPDLFFLSARASVRRAVREGYRRAFCVQWTGALAALAGRRLDPGFEIHVAAHGRELLFNPLPGPFAGVYDRLRRRVLGRANGVYPVSRYTADLALDLGVAAERIHVVSNGADPLRFKPTDRHEARRRFSLPNNPVILTLCRLVSRKGVDTVIRSFRSVLVAWPEATLIVAGDGPERSSLERLAADIGVSTHVRFLGSVPYDQVPALFSAADVFALVPRESRPDVEGFGLVYLEASACEIPVIGARSGGIPDAVIDGVTGLLVPPDDPEGLAAALEHVLRHENIALTLGEAGRRHVLEYANWDRMVERLLAAFDGH